MERASARGKAALLPVVWGAGGLVMSVWDNLPDDTSAGDPRAPWNEPDEDEERSDYEQRHYDRLRGDDYLLFGFPSSTGNHD